MPDETEEHRVWRGAGELLAREGDAGDVRAGFHRSLAAIDEVFTQTALALAEAMPVLHRRYLDGDPDVVAEAGRLAEVTQQRVREVEDAAFVLLAREAPVGRDLRQLVALLRIVRDVDRSAALFAHACATVSRVDPRTLPTDTRRFVDELARRAHQVFARGVEAWRRRDALALAEIDDLDELVDRLQEQLYRELSERFGAGDEPMTLGLLTRYLERIADHGVAIARDTSFFVTGDRVGASR